ncbi:hypothetical protein M0R04_13745 [Candidatus Dojkabacteria bacterium]|jgi:hypothetical protein|nr:hypothetical protein [Candidatus Dojkabacteria bacterium]
MANKEKVYVCKVSDPIGITTKETVEKKLTKREIKDIRDWHYKVEVLKEF